MRTCFILSNVPPQGKLIKIRKLFFHTSQRSDGQSQVSSILCAIAIPREAAQIEREFRETKLVKKTNSPGSLCQL